MRIAQEAPPLPCSGKTSAFPDDDEPVPGQSERPANMCHPEQTEGGAVALPRLMQMSPRNVSSVSESNDALSGVTGNEVKGR